MHGEIEIKAGQLVTVLEKCDDWFRGEASGRYGYFPGNYVQKAGDKDPGDDLTDIDMFPMNRRCKSHCTLNIVLKI
jgi:hypothetical protein